MVSISVNIALTDTTKSLLKDLEADELKGNNAYVFFLKELSEISRKILSRIK